MGIFIKTAALIAVTSLLVENSAFANTLKLYQDGDYRGAIASAEVESSAASLALSARAHLSLVDLGQSVNKKKDLKAALENAKTALKLDPNNIEAHLMKVAALGYRARGRSNFRNFTNGTASKSLKHIKAALALEPNSAWAYAMLGVWNLEIIRRAGKSGAQITGANTQNGLMACQYALASVANDGAICLQCGLSLLALGDSEMEEAAFTALRSAAMLSGNITVYDRAMIERAREVLSLYEAQGIAAARQRALAYLSYDGT